MMDMLIPLSAKSPSVQKHSTRGLLLAVLLAAGMIYPIQQAKAQAPTTLSTLLVQRMVGGASWTVDASVEAVRQATLSAQINGRVLTTPVDAGSSVKAGTVLMRLDAREAIAASNATQAQLTQAKAQLERNQRLLAQGFISPAAMDKLQADYKTAVAQANQTVAAASYGTISAPFAGIVGQRLAEVGDSAFVGKPLLTVFDPRQLRLVVAVPTSQLAAIQNQPHASVELANGLRLEAKRVEILPTIDNQTRTATVRVYLPDTAVSEQGIHAMPGMSARVTFAANSKTNPDNQLSIPATAVIQRGELNLVYVKSGATIQLRQLRLGKARLGQVSVLAGLKAGETIYTDPIKAGMRMAAQAPSVGK